MKAFRMKIAVVLLRCHLPRLVAIVAAIVLFGLTGARAQQCAILIPEPGDILDNGCMFEGAAGDDGFSWEFAWEAFPDATTYHLYVERYGATYPAVDNSNIATTSYVHDFGGGYIADWNLDGWYCRVRAFVNGNWTNWSEEVPFEVEAVDTDCLCPNIELENAGGAAWSARIDWSGIATKSESIDNVFIYLFDEVNWYDITDYCYMSMASSWSTSPVIVPAELGSRFLVYAIVEVGADQYSAMSDWIVTDNDVTGFWGFLQTDIKIRILSTFLELRGLDVGFPSLDVALAFSDALVQAYQGDTTEAWFQVANAAVASTPYGTVDWAFQEFAFGHLGQARPLGMGDEAYEDFQNDIGPTKIAKVLAYTLAEIGKFAESIDFRGGWYNPFESGNSSVDWYWMQFGEQLLDIADVFASFWSDLWDFGWFASFDAYSPIDLRITGPDGSIVSREDVTMANAVYLEREDATQGEWEDRCLLFRPLPGDYQVNVIVEPGVASTEVYSIQFKQGGLSVDLATDVAIEDAPDVPYTVIVEDLPVSNAISTPVVTTSLRSVEVRIDLSGSNGFGELSLWRKNLNSENNDWVIVDRCEMQPGNKELIDECVTPGAAYSYQIRIKMLGADSVVWWSDNICIPYLSAVGLDAYPNPFNPAVQVDFYIPTDGHVSVHVYDAVGHLVCTLVNTTLAAGPHLAAWGGKDSANRAVAAGSYIIRLETDSEVHSKKILLLK